MPAATPASGGGWPDWAVPSARCARLSPGRAATGADGNYQVVTIARVGARHIVDSEGHKYRPAEGRPRDIHAEHSIYLVPLDAPVIDAIDERRRRIGAALIAAAPAAAGWRRDPSDLTHIVDEILDALAPFTTRITPR